MKTPEFANKLITHEKDIEYFNDFSAPLMELIHSTHYTNINSTIAFFGPMLYFFVRSIGAEQVLEIGHAEGYTSWYLANAVKDNATRFQMAGNKYHGIDIIGQKPSMVEGFEKHNLPSDIRCMDSMDLTPETFGKTFDVIFQDGNHDTEHVIKEFETMWPALKEGGKGYWLMHDVMGPAEDGYKAIRQLIKDGKYNAEYVAIDCVYGLGIIRKMDNFDLNASHWSE
ncbi:MAG TPA: class I SAM-dependent methyltransferase [Desulfosporosinus sp.]|nr:class I SAM-dependent methyltransferase [Desulfosporosinus sp.]